MDLFDVPHWRFIEKQQTARGYQVSAEYLLDPASCLKCETTGKLYKHGATVTTYLDRPLAGTPVRLQVKVRRYKCRHCGGTFLQSLAGIEPTRRLTERCIEYILQQSPHASFQRIAEHLACDEKTIRNVVNEFSKPK